MGVVRTNSIKNKFLRWGKRRKTMRARKLSENMAGLRKIREQRSNSMTSFTQNKDKDEFLKCKFVKISHLDQLNENDDSMQVLSENLSDCCPSVERLSKNNDLVYEQMEKMKVQMEQMHHETHSLMSSEEFLG